MGGAPYRLDAGVAILGDPTLQAGSIQPAEHPDSVDRMPHTTLSSVRRAFVFLVAGVSACGGDLVLPDPSGVSGNVAMTKLGGDGQVGTVGEPLPGPLVVQVFTEARDPVPGRKVAFALPDQAAGTVTPDTAETKDDGRATAQWVLGTTIGPQVAVARLGDDTTQTQVAEFTATAKAAAPDNVSAVSSLAQPGRRQQEVGTPPQVKVVDRYGNPVQDAEISWRVTAGQGQVPAPTTLTDAEGKTSTPWTLGNRIGVHKLTAAVGDVSVEPVTFTATVLF